MCRSVHCLVCSYSAYNHTEQNNHSKQYCPLDYMDAIKCSFSFRIDAHTDEITQSGRKVNDAHLRRMYEGGNVSGKLKFWVQTCFIQEPDYGFRKTGGVWFKPSRKHTVPTCDTVKWRSAWSLFCSSRIIKTTAARWSFSLLKEKRVWVSATTLNQCFLCESPTTRTRHRNQLNNLNFA